MIRTWLSATIVAGMIASTSNAQVNRQNHTLPPIRPGGIGTGIGQGINVGVGGGINQGINVGVGGGINQGINVGVGGGINRGINVGVGGGINQGGGLPVQAGMNASRIGGFGQGSPSGSVPNSPSLNQSNFGASTPMFSPQQTAIPSGIGGTYTTTTNTGGISAVQLRDNPGQLGGNTFQRNQSARQIGQNAYQPAYSRHPVYRGYWNYGVGPSTNGGSVARSGSATARGVGSWWVGALAYNSGYLGYFNPYYNSEFGSFGNYNYSQPFPVFSSNESAGVLAADAISGDTSLMDAVEEFKQMNYDAALDHIDKAISICPDDSVLHEMRGLILFAMGDYPKAAAVIHPVLAAGPGWNWATLCRMYPDISLYAKQLRSLEDYRTQHPQDAASRFLLGYFYMTGGYQDAAAEQFKKVVKRQPDDQIAADLVRMLAKPTSDPSTMSEQPPTPEPPATVEPMPATSNAAKPVDPVMLVGTWRAERNDVSKFELTLTSNSHFHWKFTQHDRVTQITGTYTVNGQVLTLTRSRGGSMVAVVHPDGDQKFNFKLLDSSSDDPGLNFSR